MEEMEKEIAEALAKMEEAETAENMKENNTVQQPPKKAPKKKMQTSKKVLIVILSVLLALLLLVLAALLYVDRLVGLISQETTAPPMNDQEMQEFLEQNKETMDPDFTGEVIDPGEVEWENHDGNLLSSDDVVNILLIGQDRRPGESRARSDSMILCSFNKATKELTLTSFMRDMYVSIPGYSAHKINSSFAWGGMSLLNNTIKHNFGIVIDGNFAVDFNSFTDVIDIVGGVDIYLTASEANYINGYKYSEGVNHLDGEGALAYARIRNIGNADFGRTQRQRNVINAVVKKCMTMSLGELNDLMEQVLPLLSTNMDKGTIMGYAAELLPMVAGLKINESLRIPADGTFTYAWVSDMSVLKTDFDANHELLRENIYE
ncbi:MAG: LCP family protein [Oscillospiraceae bacterium]|nr:LCP family protein [Oscillospiraceae bacterium]